MNTKIKYEYRDAGNYKASDYFIARGELSEKQRKDIEACHDFVPYLVGAQHLHTILQSWDTNGDPDLDHCFHETQEAELTEEAPTINMSAEEAYKAIVSGEADVAIDIDDIPNEFLA